MSEPAAQRLTSEIDGDPVAALAELVTPVMKDSLSTTLVIGTPGLVDRDGCVGPALYSRISHVNLRRRLLNLVSEIEVVAIANDASLLAAGVAELEHSSISASHLHVVTGTAIGGALLIDGALYLGEHGFAGEVGHVRAGLSNVRCLCGEVDCVDLVASGWSLEADLGAGWWNRAMTATDRERLALAATALARAIGTCHQIIDLASFSITGPLVATVPWLGELIVDSLTTHPRLRYVDISRRTHWELATAGAVRLLEIDRLAYSSRLDSQFEQP